MSLNLVIISEMPDISSYMVRKLINLESRLLAAEMQQNVPQKRFYFSTKNLD